MNNAIKNLGVSFGIVLLTALWASPASAFPTYSCDGTGEDGTQQILCFDGADGTNPDSGNCSSCHGGFREGGYVSNTADDPAAWGNELMNGHVNAYGLSCSDCHTAGGRTPTFLDAADGGITCANCHGREEDITPNDGAFGGPGPGRADGLRAHHAAAGITRCADCHTADTTPIGEDVPSATFVALGIDPCDENGTAAGTGNIGNVGLDQDGDDLREPDDPDCAEVAGPTPDIKANGADGPIVVAVGSPLSITVALDAGGNGAQADWWVVAQTPFGLFFSTLQAPLSNLAPLEVLNLSGLPPGAYIFAFAVDLTANGTLDQPLFFDVVRVNIQ